VAERHRCALETTDGGDKPQIAPLVMAEVERELVARIGANDLERLRALLDIDWHPATSP
jgi:hypothetical protein